MDQKKVISTLNDLIENCKDGEYGFRRTAEHLSSGSLRQVFLTRAEECQRGAQELQGLVMQLGGDPEEKGTVAGAAHRGWVAVKGALGGDSDLSMLEEAERGEDTALARYRSALEEELPAEIRMVVQRQYEGAKRNHEVVRELRDRERLREKG